MKAYFVALLCKGVIQSDMLFSCSCYLLLWSCVITIFDLDEAFIPARRMYSLFVILMDIFRPNWPLV